MKDRLSICNDLMNIAAIIVTGAVEYNRCVLSQFVNTNTPEVSKQLKKEIKSLHKMYNIILDRLGCWRSNRPEVINSIMGLAKEILNNKLVYFNDISKLMLDTDKIEKINELNNDMESIRAAIALIEKHENKWDRWM